MHAFAILLAFENLYRARSEQVYRTKYLLINALQLNINASIN